jgi:RNA polymerase sigma-70 factor (ECF subfamily)
VAESSPKVPKPEDRDVELVQQCLGGDYEAFDALVERYQKKVVNLCFHRLRHYEEACDLAQEIFVQAFQNLKEFEGRSAFSTWLYRVAVNACFNRQKFLRAKGRNRGGSLDQALERQSADPAFRSREKDALSHLESGETSRRVHQALESLNLDYQKVVHLVDLEGFEYQEAAQILKVPVNTVRSRLSRARVALKEALEKNERAEPQRA